MEKNTVVLVICSSLAVMVYCVAITEAQANGRGLMFLGNDNNLNGHQTEVSPIFRMLNNMVNVNVPAIYEMTKNGSSLGINVLSGLVRVDRGEAAERSGLQGRLPLSVRIFGFPIYERGHRVRDLDTGILSGNNGNNGPKTEIEDEELPIES